MNKVFIRIKADDTMLPDVLSTKLDTHGTVYISYSRFKEAIGDSYEILVSLDSANNFVSLYRILTAYMRDKEDANVTLERDGRSLILNGPTMPERAEMAQIFVPELAAD